MKIQLNTSEKTITLDSNVLLSDLVKHLDKLLPKDSPFGHWRDYSLQTNTVINNWSNPIYIPYYQNHYHWWQQPYTYCGTGGLNVTSSVESFTVTADATGSATNPVFNLELPN